MSRIELKNIVLASTSPYRRKLLANIGISANCVAPLADESTISPETHTPQEVAEKRAELKARSVANLHPESIIIGSDQLVSFKGKILGKPGHHEKAVEQLKLMRGQTHELITSIFFLEGNSHLLETNITRLNMFDLSDQEIENYVRIDQPFDCAGSYKVECHGLWLFEKIETDDWSAIQGLPLTSLINYLSRSNQSLLKSST